MAPTASVCSGGCDVGAGAVPAIGCVLVLEGTCIGWESGGISDGSRAESRAVCVRQESGGIARDRFECSVTLHVGEYVCTTDHDAF